MSASVTVCVPHVDTPHYAIGCVEAILRQAHPDVSVEVLVVDQSGPAAKAQMHAALDGRPGVRVLDAKRVDAGWPIDVAARVAGGEFLCSLDCDAFPIHRNWLALPLRLIREHGADWVGSDTGLAQAYTKAGIPGPYIHLNNYFRVCRTSAAREASLAVGFLRWENHYKTGHQPLERAWPGMHCDNGVVAQWRASQRRERMASLAITAALGHTPKMGLYGMIIEGLVFHLVFGFGEEWIADLRDTLGGDYLALRDRLRSEGVTAAALTDLLARCRPIPFGRHLDGGPMPAAMLAAIEEGSR